VIDEGVKWYIGTYEPTRREPPTGVHEWRTSILAYAAGVIESSARAVETGASYNHLLGNDQANPMRGVELRIADVKPRLRDKWSVVRALAECVRRLISGLGGDRGIARYVDLDEDRGPLDIDPDRVSRAVVWTRRVFRKWKMPNA
jgi:hypothetical protein